MHRERYEISPEAAAAINERETLRGKSGWLSEPLPFAFWRAANLKAGLVLPGSGTTNIFIHPALRVRNADALLTNFHLPRSTLLMLVSAFAAPGEPAAVK